MKIIRLFLLSTVLAFAFQQSHATIIDTNPGWDGSINNGWLGSGQSLTVDATDTFFEYITFYFDAESNGKTFDFELRDALNGGSTLFSTSFTVSGLANTLFINQNMAANALLFAQLDYRGFNGRTAHFSYTDSYAGGNSSFGAIGAQGDWASLDHRFIAKFTSVPEPSTLMVLLLALIGFVVYRQR